MKKIILILFLFFISSNSSFAKEIEISNDLGDWNNINISLPLTKKIATRFQISPRILNNFSDFNQFIFHSSLGYRFNKNLSFWQAYAFNTTYIPDFRIENRVYQDAILEHSFKNISFENRFRFEERFLENVDEISLRGRYRLKAVIPLIKKKKVYLSLFDEIFFNLNDAQNGPQSGLDQNRVFVGLGKEINDYLTLELGYQLQHQNRIEPSKDRLNHFILTNINLQFPQIFKTKD